MLDTIFGLPVHPLIVHATTVVVPAAALSVLLAALWPRFRRWAAWLPLALSVAAVVLTPLSTESGEALERHVEQSALIETHSELAEGLLPWVVGLAVAAVVLYVVTRRERQSVAAHPSEASAGSASEASSDGRVLPRRLLVAGAVIGLVAALGTTVQVVRIGHSGAQAAWGDAVTQTQTPPTGGEVDGQ